MRNIYLPDIGVVAGINQETSDTRTFRIALKDPQKRQEFSFMPGQFVEISVFGVGEAPFGFASSPRMKHCFEITVRRVGSVTAALHELREQDEVGVRGPCGNCFPVEETRGKDVLFVAGGIGLPPLRSLIHYMLEERESFGRILVLYGARTPHDIVYRDELDRWLERKDMELRLTVDVGDETWKGPVGVVTRLFEGMDLDPARTRAFVCGPPIMIHFAVRDLEKLGFAPEDIVSTLERMMKCGVGKCGHCAIGEKYVCIDGPVFNFRQIRELAEKD